MPNETSLWPIVIFWGGAILVSLFCSNKSKSSSEKQEDNKKEDAADPVKQKYDHQSKENHDAGEYAYVLGQSYKDEDNNMAVKYFTEAIACGIEDANVFGLRGTCLHNLNRQHEAIKDYSKALELEPSDCNTYYMRAMAKKMAGDYIGFEDDMHLAINFARLSTPMNDVYNLGARQQGFSSVEALYKDTLLMLRPTIDTMTSTVIQCAKYRRDTGLPLTLEAYAKIEKKEEEDKKRIMASRSWLP
jgi:tetratricopeptide (TPR) repeat protein